MGVKSRPSNSPAGLLPDDASILADVLFGGSLDLAKPVQFIRPHALPEHNVEDLWRMIEGACWEVWGEVIYDVRHRKHVGKRGPVLKTRGKTLAAMRDLLQELETDLDDCLSTQLKHDVDLRSEAKVLGTAVRSLQKSIDAIEHLVTFEKAGLTRPAPNTDLFSAEFVKAVREAWQRITGEPAGVARRVVVDFALELWEAVGLPDHGSETTTRDWLEERFKNVR